MNTTISMSIKNGPSEWLRLFLVILFIIILLIGLFGNCLVLLSAITNHRNIHRSSTNLLLVNMSYADLIILIFNIFDIAQFSFDPYWPTAWYLGLSFCKIVRFSQVFGCYVSVQTLLTISIERYISIIHPIKISQINHRKRLYLIFILIWSLGFLMALPNLYLLELHPFHNRPQYYVCGLSDQWIDSHLITFYKYAESILFFFLPAFIQTILYLIICRKIFLVDRAVKYHGHAQAIQQVIISNSLQRYSDTKLSSSLPSPLMNNNTVSLSPQRVSRVIKATNNNGNKARRKAIIMILIVAILYFIAFSPIQINFIYTQINHSHHLYEHRLFFIVTILLVLSSTAFNPIIFYIFSKYFRCKFQILLRCLCPSCRLSTKQRNNFGII
ncbi:unnamed protein product [Rotaria socialis]|uniref:G-protein coupled receptors family 1 profile domain-containing protein n=2 Tax=Rotaria socialis TaxID=392032 RepID=A0A819YUI0_9BILA|nr:unnamed protein product [Rotaria socialis]CAF3395078.1 unnamed protein product [Rotaria socialis]CAF3406530.1 unnamed protein product [Rotaria socialis]CAF3514466.1 unnamed protein product [Rotaria socialis]CAF3673913.1 unnamed protein product [Rotaria socialis]